MNVLMVGVSEKRLGGMWTVANNYLSDKEFCKETNIKYIATSTNGNAFVRTLYMMVGILKVFFYLLNHDVDIVHVHMAEKGSVFRKGIVVKISKIFRVKVIIHMHAGPFIAWFDSQKKRIQNMTMDILNTADRVFVLGEFWKNEMSQIVDEKKIKVLYNGIDIPEYNLYKKESKDIIFMGVLKREKGVFDLIDAIKLIDEQLEKFIKVKLCGVDMESKVETYIKESKLEHRFCLMGWVNEEERTEIYKNAVVSVLPSYYEGLSMTIIESMSYGIPVVTTDISTMGEILGEEIRLVHAGDVKGIAEQILGLLQDDELRDKISKIEFERTGRIFTLEKMIEKTYDEYCELIN